jgi:hypothetical protein
MVDVLSPSFSYAEQQLHRFFVLGRIFPQPVSWFVDAIEPYVSPFVRNQWQLQEYSEETEDKIDDYLFKLVMINDEEH